jgi:5-methylthioadenosine/S-adenosylhomocysteine deaminase
MTKEKAMDNIDKLIVHGLVVTVDDDETLIEDGAIAISGTDIVAIGPFYELSPQYRAAEVIDATGHIVMPGLINAHAHNGMTLYRGLVDDMPLETWLEIMLKAESQFVSPDTVKLGARLAYAEMIRGGTTMSLDMYWHPAASAQAAREAGFRLMNGLMFIDFDEAPDRISVDQRIELGREFLEEYRDDPLIERCVFPHTTYTVAPENLKKTRALADEFGVFWCTHVSETAAEVSTVMDRYGRTPPRHLDHLGLLSDRTVLAHCVHLSDEEVDMLAERGTVAVHCPLSNLKLASGIAPVPRMRQAGVCVTLGTDGAASGNDLDMWMAMRLAAVVHRGVHGDPTFLPAPEVVNMVTCDAARALGLGDRVGSLEVGKRADIIIIDLNRPHLVPLYDVYSHLVYAVGRDDVSTVLINGQVVMRNRQLLTTDEQATMAEVRAMAQQIAEVAAV